MTKSFFDTCKDIFNKARELAPHSPDRFRGDSEAFNPTTFNKLRRQSTTNAKTDLHYVAMLQSRPSTLPADEAHVLSEAVLNLHLDTSSPKRSFLDPDTKFRTIRLPGSPVAPFQQFSPVGIQRLKDIIAAEKSISAELKEKLNNLTHQNAWYFTLTEEEAHHLKSTLGLHENAEYRRLGSMIYKHLTVSILTDILHSQSLYHSKTLQGNLYRASDEEHTDLIVGEAKASARFGIGSHYELATITATLLMQSTELPKGTDFQINVGQHEDTLNEGDFLNYQIQHYYVSIQTPDQRLLIMDPWSNTFGYDSELEYRDFFNRGIKPIFTSTTGSRPLTEEERLTPREAGDESIPFTSTYSVDLVRRLQTNLHATNREFNERLNIDIKANQKEFNNGVKALSKAQAASLVMDLVDTGPMGSHTFRVHQVLALRPDLQKMLDAKDIKIPPAQLENTGRIRMPARRGQTQNVSLNTINRQDYQALAARIFEVLKPLILESQPTAVRASSVRHTTFGGASTHGGTSQEPAEVLAP